MRKPRANEREPHRRPVGPGELAHHSEAVRFSPGGKWGGCVAEDCVLTWGDLSGAIPAEVSRSRSGRRAVVEEMSRGLKDARLNCEAGGLTR